MHSLCIYLDNAKKVHLIAKNRRYNVWNIIMLESNVKYNIIDELVLASFEHDVTYLYHNICC